jgi:hypothetical protein
VHFSVASVSVVAKKTLQGKTFLIHSKSFSYCVCVHLYPNYVNNERVLKFKTFLRSQQNIGSLLKMSMLLSKKVFFPCVPGIFDRLVVLLLFFFSFRFTPNMQIYNIAKFDYSVSGKKTLFFLSQSFDITQLLI